MVDLTLSDADKTRITAAVAAAESKTSAQIVTIIAPFSSDYNDIASDWAILIGIFALALYASFTPLFIRFTEGWLGTWDQKASVHTMLLVALFGVMFKVLVTKLLLRWDRLRLWMTHRRIKRFRVHRRALLMFNATTAGRTGRDGGVLIYLSEDERMAEIIADEAIHVQLTDAVWDDAMAALVNEVKHGRVAEGMIAAINLVGQKLAQQFPHIAGNTNSLPDAVITL